MDKFTGLYIKTKGEWGLHGKLDSDFDGKVKEIRQITDANGKIKAGQKSIQAEAACLIHSTKGTSHTRKFS